MRFFIYHLPKFIISTMIVISNGSVGFLIYVMHKLNFCIDYTLAAPQTSNGNETRRTNTLLHSSLVTSNSTVINTEPIYL